jgi:putative transposase
MVREKIVSGEFYHIYNRGVEKRNVFLDEDDRYRFVFSLYECNDANYVVMRDRIGERLQRNSKISIGETYGNSLAVRKKREPLAEIAAFTLMPNHYHLIVRQIAVNGIPSFMKKLSNSYTGYFNGKYERKGMGALFQGAYKAVRIADNNQFFHLVEYIFSNPVEIIDPGWKHGAKNPAEAIAFLNNYKWSSYLDSIGIKNFPSVTERSLIDGIFSSSGDTGEGGEKIKQCTESWITNKANLSKNLAVIGKLSLE